MLPARIYDPIFPDACIRIQIQFAYIVMAGCAGRNNLNDPVRRSGAAALRQFTAIADYADIRPDKRLFIFFEPDCKRSRIDPANYSNPAP